MKNKFTALCTENGENFHFDFKLWLRPKEDADQIKKVADYIALGWGGCCHKVILAEDQSDVDKVYDASSIRLLVTSKNNPYRHDTAGAENIDGELCGRKS